MTISFVTTLRATGSTIIGRTLPLATQLAARGHTVHILLLAGAATPDVPGITWHIVGREPFIRTSTGKQRLNGWRLVTNMLMSVYVAARTLRSIRSDIVVIVKPLPANTLAVRLSQLLVSRRPSQLVLDSDDFELTANQLGSIIQRAAVHWSERQALRLATHIVAATPFLVDHYRQLSADSKPVSLLPTGLSLSKSLLATSPVGWRLVYIGSVSISSGHRVDLLPALLREVRRQYPDIELTIIGDGHDIPVLKQKFTALGLTAGITWIGRFDATRAAEYITAQTIIIDPIDASIAVRAKSSYRVALATLLGVPIVTSNVGIRAELIPDQLHARTFATPMNAPSYAERIVEYITTPLTSSQRDTLQQHAKDYTWDALTTSFCKLLSI